MSGQWERLFQHRVQEFGQVGQDFYVVDSDFAGSTGGDQSSGLVDLVAVMAPGRVFLTGRYADDSAAIQAAIDATVGSRGDVVHFCPGDYRIIDSVALNKRGIRLLGPPVRHPARAMVTFDGDTTAGLADELFNVTAADIEIGFVKFIPDSGQAVLDYSAAADGLYVHDFFLDFRTPAVDVQTRGFRALTTSGAGANNPRFENYHVECDGAQGAAFITPGTVDGLNKGGMVSLSTGTWASPFDVGAAVERLWIEGIRFTTTSTGVFTTCIDGVNATIVGGVTCAFLNFPARDTVAANSMVPIDNFGASECGLIECYEAGLGGGDGGVLVTAIT